MSSVPATLENWYAPGTPVNIGIAGSLGMVFDNKNRAKFTYDTKTDKVDLLWPKTVNNKAGEALENLTITLQQNLSASRCSSYRW